MRKKSHECFAVGWWGGRFRSCPLETDSYIHIRTCVHISYVHTKGSSASTGTNLCCTNSTTTTGTCPQHHAIFLSSRCRECSLMARPGRTVAQLTTVALDTRGQTVARAPTDHLDARGNVGLPNEFGRRVVPLALSLDNSCKTRPAVSSLAGNKHARTLPTSRRDAVHDILGFEWSARGASLFNVCPLARRLQQKTLDPLTGSSARLQGTAKQTSRRRHRGCRAFACNPLPAWLPSAASRLWHSLLS